MARNRKRAKERRARRPAGAPIAAAARRDRDAAPDPIEHAAPDAELAEAQLAVGRPELVDDAVTGEPEGDDELQVTVEPFETDDVEQPFGEPADDALEDGHAADVEEAYATPRSGPPAKRERPGNRLVTFVQGSWRELQRVQWPDRRQVMQATGVVIGFVIVAGVFLGVADTLSAKLMNLILK